MLSSWITPLCSTLFIVVSRLVHLFVFMAIHSGAFKMKFYNVQKNEESSNKIYTSKTHDSLSMSKLNKLWMNRKLCDVKLKIDGKELLAHRIILSINSDYFDAMFSNWYEEHNKEEVQLDCLTYDAVNTLVEYMYTGFLTLTVDNVQNVFVAADLLQMEEMKNLCATYLVEAIDATNCLGMMNLGETYNCKDLYEKAIQLIKRQFPVICKTEEFSTLSFKSLLQILSFEDLDLGWGGEDILLEAVLTWLEKSPDSSTVDVTTLIKHIQLKHVSETVKQQLLESPVIKSNEESQKQIKAQLEEASSKLGRRPVQSIYVVGGFLQSRTGAMCPRLKSVERYDIQRNTWDRLTDLPTLTYGAQILNLYGRMFVITCEVLERQLNGDKEHLSILEYNPLLDKWKNAAEHFSAEVLSVFHECLSLSGNIIAVCRHNSIYAISNKSTDIVQVDISEGEITSSKSCRLPPATHLEEGHMSHFSTVRHNGDVYVVGGEVKRSQLEIFSVARVAMFDGAKWIDKENMLEPRSTCAAVSCGGYLYAVGGFNTRRVNTVERYDVCSNQWTYISCLNKERSHLNAVVIYNKIYVMGGKSYSSSYGGARKVLNTCEVYDPDSNKWTYIAPMHQSRCMFGTTAF